MALATNADVEARLGRDLTEAEEGRAEALLDDASAIVIGYCGTDFEPPPYPSAVVGVVAKMVARTLSRGEVTGGEFAEQQNAGPFGVRYSSASSAGDMWLTAADKLALRPWRRGGGMVSVGLVSERYDFADDESSSSSSSSESSSSSSSSSSS